MKNTGEILKIWKTIKLGTHKDVKALCEALKQTGCGISGWAKNILGNSVFTVNYVEKEIDLVIVSNSDLGKPQGCLLGETIDLALSIGLEKCPAEVGPQSYLQNLDKFEGEFCVGMEPILDFHGHFGIFFVGRAKERWLDIRDGNPGCFRGGDSLFIFALRR